MWEAILSTVWGLSKEILICLWDWTDPALTFVMLINFVFFAFFCGGVQPHMPLVYKMFASAKTVVPGLTVRQLFAFFTFWLLIFSNFYSFSHKNTVYKVYLLAQVSCPFAWKVLSCWLVSKSWTAAAASAPVTPCFRFMVCTTLDLVFFFMRLTEIDIPHSNL